MPARNFPVVTLPECLPEVTKSLTKLDDSQQKKNKIPPETINKLMGRSMIFKAFYVHQQSNEGVPVYDRRYSQ